VERRTHVPAVAGTRRIDPNGTTAIPRPAAAAVQHPTSSFSRFRSLAGALLELDLIRLAGIHQRFELFLDHVSIATVEGLTRPTREVAC
jgi:hypothetical protein